MPALQRDAIPFGKHAYWPRQRVSEGLNDSLAHNRRGTNPQRQIRSWPAPRPVFCPYRTRSAAANPRFLRTRYAYQWPTLDLMPNAAPAQPPGMSLPRPPPQPPRVWISCNGHVVWKILSSRSARLAKCMTRIFCGVLSYTHYVLAIIVFVMVSIAAF